MKPVPANTKVTIELELADALSVGHSMRHLARSPKHGLTPGTADIYVRVGNSLVEAARVAIEKGQDR